MKKVDWESMTPAEVFEALRTAPRVAGPWEPGSTGREDRGRRDVRFRRVGLQVSDRWVGIHYGNDTADACYESTIDGCDNPQEADQILRREGWILVDPLEPLPVRCAERKARR